MQQTRYILLKKQQHPIKPTTIRAYVCFFYLYWITSASVRYILNPKSTPLTHSQYSGETNKERPIY